MSVCDTLDSVRDNMSVEKKFLLNFMSMKSLHHSYIVIINVSMQLSVLLKKLNLFKLLKCLNDYIIVDY